MSDLRDLYQEVILDHNRQPRNFRVPDGHTHHGKGYNPLCGDKVEFFATVADGRIADVAFDGAGCAISTASASMLTDALKGRTVEEATELFEAFTKLVTGDGNATGEELDVLGKLQVFQGVCEFPTRVKCATLVWHTMKAALEQAEDPTVSTE